MNEKDNPSPHAPQSLGWSAMLEEQFSVHARAGLIPGRIAIQHRGAYTVFTVDGEIRAHVPGKMRYGASDLSDMPAVGDWVALQRPERTGAAIIRAVLPRKSMFVRKIAGARTLGQVVAANVDIAFLVSGLDEEFNVRRIERYLVTVLDSGASPVVLLNKVDLCEHPGEFLEQVRVVAPGIPVFAISAVRDLGLDDVRRFLGTGITAVLLGSSGVGKSTIINRLLGVERQAVQEVRMSDGQGRHTTSQREMVLLPQGGIVIDTPGMREIQMWSDGESMTEAFSDIEELAVQCKFRDCSHEVEPGCAVRAAMDEGRLDPARYQSYRKLQREIAWMSRRKDEAAQRAEKERLKKIQNELKQVYKFRKRRS